MEDSNLAKVIMTAIISVALIIITAIIATSISEITRLETVETKKTQEFKQKD